MHDSSNPRARAIAALAEMFLDLSLGSESFASIESKAIDLGRGCMAEALGLALEAYDAHLLGSKPRGLRSHDIRERTLATEIGDVSFSIRRYRDRFGCDVYLLADALDIPYNSRASPGATGFLVGAAAHVSCAKAAHLLARHGSQVRPTSVMRCMGEAGALCAKEDALAAKALYEEGAAPDAKDAQKELCMEADGTYFRVQRGPIGTPKHLEVKAMVAYAGKEASRGKVRRRGCARHALVGGASGLWSEAIASAVGKRYGLSATEHVHLGGDGEKWCRDAERFLPRAEVTFHLDPFHVNHAVLACFGDAAMAWNVVEVIEDGDVKEAISLLEACLDLGIARERRTRAVVPYLQGNIGHIAIDGPSLGTIESDDQHLYGARTDSFPCAWSIRGASDMARIISRRESKTAVPERTREGSRGERRRKLRERKGLSFYAKQGSAAEVLESVGSGYLPPHQADTRRMRTDKAYALYRGMADLDRGI